MRRVLVPGLLAIAMIASTSANASAFGLFDRLCHRGCDSGCDVACEPVCGCEVPCEPACGVEVACEPVCGCEPSCCRPKRGLLHNLFHRHDHCCDTGCEVIEPACGCEAPCEPVCGVEVACEPVCSCEPACGHSRGSFGGLLHKLFHRDHDHCCDSGCEVIEPVCGCEAAPACGCGL